MSWAEKAHIYVEWAGYRVRNWIATSLGFYDPTVVRFVLHSARTLMRDCQGLRIANESAATLVEAHVRRLREAVIRCDKEWALRNGLVSAARRRPKYVNTMPLGRNLLRILNNNDGR